MKGCHCPYRPLVPTLAYSHNNRSRSLFSNINWATSECVSILPSGIKITKRSLIYWWICCFLKISLRGMESLRWNYREKFASTISQINLDATWQNIWPLIVFTFMGSLMLTGKHSCIIYYEKNLLNVVKDIFHKFNINWAKSFYEFEMNKVKIINLWKKTTMKIFPWSSL